MSKCLKCGYRARIRSEFCSNVCSTLHPIELRAARQAVALERIETLILKSGKPRIEILNDCLDVAREANSQ